MVVRTDGMSRQLIILDPTSKLITCKDFRSANGVGSGWRDNRGVKLFECRYTDANLFLQQSCVIDETIFIGLLDSNSTAVEVQVHSRALKAE